MFLIGRNGRIAPEQIGELTLDVRIADDLMRSSPQFVPVYFTSTAPDPAHVP
jgi:hypothetical protein